QQVQAAEINEPIDTSEESLIVNERTDNYTMYFSGSGGRDNFATPMERGSGNGRPRTGSGTRPLNSKEWNCLRTVYGSMFSALGSPWTIPFGIWSSATACHGL